MLSASESADFMVHINKFKEEIKRIITEEQYNAINPSVIDDFAKMGAYLKIVTLPELALHFRTLSEKLEEKYRILGMVEATQDESGNVSKRINNENKTKVESRNVFTKTLEEWAKQNGFNLGGKVHCIVEEDSKRVRKLISLPDKIPVAFNFIKLSTFRGLLSLGYFLKDVGVGKEHGEFTHILTFYLLVEANKHTPFLKHSPADLYKMLGNERCFNPLINAKKNPPVSIWDVIFDKIRTDEANNSAENFNKLLREQLKDNPSTEILIGFINSRYEKRAKVESQVSSKASGELLAKRMADAKGLLLDETVFFYSAYADKQHKVNYDEVSDICHYDPKIDAKFTAPQIENSQDNDVLTNIIAMFDSSTWANADPIMGDVNTKELATQISARLTNLRIEHSKDGLVPHRLIAETLESLLQTKTEINIDDFSPMLIPSAYKENRFIQHLINHSKKLLLEHDQIDIEQNYQTQQLMESEAKLAAFKF